jgi:hypothetical protein
MHENDKCDEDGRDSLMEHLARTKPRSPADCDERTSPALTHHEKPSHMPDPASPLAEEQFSRSHHYTLSDAVRSASLIHVLKMDFISQQYCRSSLSQMLCAFKSSPCNVLHKISHNAVSTIVLVLMQNDPIHPSFASQSKTRTPTLNASSPVILTLKSHASHNNQNAIYTSFKHLKVKPKPRSTHPKAHPLPRTHDE